MRDTLVATIGTSVLTNFQSLKLHHDFETWVVTQPEAERPGLREVAGVLLEAAHDLSKKRAEQAAKALVHLRFLPRVLGAEVASVSALLREPPYGGLKRAVLLFSDTDDGSLAAKFLTHFLRLRFELEVQPRRVLELRDDVPGVFRTFGLRNLVKEFARTVQEFGSNRLVFDATGGYKAQVALAVVVGQVFGVPVVYRFERFAEIIELPPLPFTLDVEFFDSVKALLEKQTLTIGDLELAVGQPLTDANPKFAKLSVALSSPNEQGDYSLSPMGQLILEALKMQKGPNSLR
ncbi:MAG: putative CRISPR-associated protein [Thermoanaerobaculum sp.]